MAIRIIDSSVISINVCFSLYCKSTLKRSTLQNHFSSRNNVQNFYFIPFFKSKAMIAITVYDWCSTLFRISAYPHMMRILSCSDTVLYSNVFPISWDYAPFYCPVVQPFTVLPFIPWKKEQVHALVAMCVHVFMHRLSVVVSERHGVSRFLHLQYISKKMK